MPTVTEGIVAVGGGDVVGVRGVAGVAGVGKGDVFEIGGGVPAGGVFGFEQTLRVPLKIVGSDL